MPNIFYKWILTNPRSGSTYLCELLNNNFNLNFQENIRNSLKKGEKVSICGLDEEKVHASDYNRIMERCLPEGIKYIYLKRDIVDSIASFYVSKKTGIWTERIDSYDMEINERSLNEYCRYYKDYSDFWDKMLKGHDFLKIYYEDLVNSPRRELDKIAEFYNFDKIDYNLETQIQKNTVEYGRLKDRIKTIIF